MFNNVCVLKKSLTLIQASLNFQSLDAAQKFRLGIHKFKRAEFGSLLYTKEFTLCSNSMAGKCCGLAFIL